MYARLAPLQKMPRTMGLFDYLVPPELESEIGRGSLVTVPWRNRPVRALVFSTVGSTEVPEARLKAVSASLGLPRLPEDVVASIERMARYCLVSPATAADAFIPQFPKKFAAPANAPAAPAGKRTDRTAGVFTIRCPSAREKFRLTGERARSCIEKNQSCLVIVPHLEDVRATAAALAAAGVAERTVLFHGDLKATEIRKAWIDLLSGGPAVVIGTRFAVLAPARDLGAIVIHESESPDLKQYDQNPRYDSRSAARTRAEAAGCELVFMSHAPRLEEWVAARDTGGVAENPVNEAELTLVDVSARGSRDEVLAWASQVAVEKALQSQKKVLLFHNRQGTAAALICSDCGRIFRCERCETALRVHGSSLKCHRCGSAEAAIPATCPDCQSPKLRTLGHGTAGLETRIRELFPEARILRFDGATKDAEHAGDFSEADIIVGTQALVHEFGELRTEPSEIGCVIATSLDDLLAHSGYRTAEEAWRTVRALRDIASASGAEIFLQCLDPAHPKARRLTAGYEDFMKKESEERRAAGYPPFGSLLAVTASDASEAGAVRAAEAVKRTILAAKIAGVEVHGPIRPEQPFRHGSWKRALIIKTGAMTPALERILRELPENCVIDPNPERIN